MSSQGPTDGQGSKGALTISPPKRLAVLEDPTTPKESPSRVRFDSGLDGGMLSPKEPGFDVDEQDPRDMEAVAQAVQQVLEHSKKNLDARDRIPYTFMQKAKSSTSLHGVAQREKSSTYNWDNIAAFAGLEDTSEEAENARTELIRRVFTYELMSKYHGLARPCVRTCMQHTACTCTALI